MSTIRVFITPFATAGAYGDEVEVTKDVKSESMTRLRQQVDNSEFEVGIFKFDDTSLTMNNQKGLYSIPGEPTTIFNHTRTNSKIRITWQIQDEEPECVVAICGSDYLSEPITIFKGILNDDASRSEIESQHVTFKVLGREGIFDQVETPYNDLVLGDDFQTVLNKILFQTQITSLFTVDVANIVLPQNQVLDALEQWQNTTVKEVLDDILLFSTAILFIRDDTLYIQGRDAGPDVKFIFYGQASNDGIENILKIDNFRLSLSNTFNYWTWTNTDLLSRDNASIDKYGVKKKSVGFDGINLNFKISALLSSLRDEFSTPKQEFDLTCPITYEVMELFISDQVRVDYPTIFKAPEGKVLPIYDLSKYDEAVYPVGEWSITISKEAPYKIMGRSIDAKNQQVTFRLREV